MPSGIWGGLHIRMDVGSSSASIDYDCANGTVDGPLTVDGNGNFKLTGTHTREPRGPVRKDNPPNRQPALYTGSIKGDTMTLTVTLTDRDEELGTFDLERGSVGKVFKCQ